MKKKVEIKEIKVLSLDSTLRAETFAGIKFRVKKIAKLLAKTFAFGQICHKFRGKNFRKFCVKLIFT